ncbi:acyltransferase [Methylocystis sp. Sn-Cys]|uniref:acyltransferase family protein n=1 Tax=Methylocystis sp. Sn-Cys TaxID=1701263 RepID=UPI001921E260|nr:acyltransferase [Methylocystis sp. Sn-Cys]MBL1255225.1 acyltransferase [Methylocystis sp. Sn-Cys]
MRAPATRLAYIDGWRVLAIMLVFLDHLGANREIGAFYEASPIGFISQYGETGVFIFFFISGYVVSRACLAEVDRSGGFSALAFYARRFFRIVPPLMLYLAFCLALGAAGFIDFSPENFLSAALYLCNTTAPDVSCNWYVGHTWTLAFEEQFYWLFPVAFAYLELGKAPRPIAAAALLFAAAPFAFTVWWIGKTGFVIAYALFFAGYAAAKHGERVIAASQGCRVPALIAAMVIVFLPRGVVASFGQDEAARAELIAYYRLLYIAAIPAMVLLSGATGPFRSMLSNRALSYVGRASYSIYLWQQLCNGPVFNDLEAIAELALTAAMVGCCLLLFPLELKLAGYGHALSKRLQARRGAVVSASAIPPAAAAVLE